MDVGKTRGPAAAYCDGPSRMTEARDRAQDRIAEERGHLMLAGLACVGEREFRKDGISTGAAA